MKWLPYKTSTISVSSTRKRENQLWSWETTLKQSISIHSTIEYASVARILTKRLNLSLNIHPDQKNKCTNFQLDKVLPGGLFTSLQNLVLHLKNISQTLTVAKY